MVKIKDIKITPPFSACLCPALQDYPEKNIPMGKTGAPQFFIIISQSGLCCAKCHKIGMSCHSNLQSVVIESIYLDKFSCFLPISDKLIQDDSPFKAGILSRDLAIIPLKFSETVAGH